MFKYNVGDKVVYYCDGTDELRTGIVTKCIEAYQWRYFYVVDTYEFYIEESRMMRHDFAECEFQALKEKRYRKKDYNYLFLTASAEDGIILHSLKINETDKMGISQRLMKEFPKMTAYNSKLFVLSAEWNIHTRRLSSKFVKLYFDIRKCRFSQSHNEWVRIEKQTEERRVKIDADTDFDGLNHLLNKDVKYLLGDLVLSHFRYSYNDADKLVIDMSKTLDLNTYFKVKKDLCSDGDEVLV